MHLHQTRLADLEERELRRANQNSIPFTESRGARHAHSVHVHAVGAVQILDEDDPLLHDDARVHPADERVVEANRAFGQATNDQPAARQLELADWRNDTHRRDEQRALGSSSAAHWL